MPFDKYFKMFSLLPLLSVALFLSSSLAEESRRLLLVQTVFRHGDRSPVFIYPNDPNKADSWPEGLGKLTQLGKRQQYAVGKFLRSMYKDFVTSNPNEVTTFTLEYERTISSALSQLAAFYAPEGRWKFQDELNWQPIPVYTRPINSDKYLSFKSTCPRAEAAYEERVNAIKTTEEFKKHKRMLQTLSHFVGYDLTRGINALPLSDTIKIEKIHNFTVPKWANTYWDELKEVGEMIYYFTLDEPVLLRLRIGPLLQNITETMMQKINGEIPDLKVHMVSGHGVNVEGILIALNFTHFPMPPYCSTLLFELHEMADATNAVRLLYSNSTDPLKVIEKPHVLVMDGCSEFCPLKTFIEKIQHWIPDDWEKECQLDTSKACKIDKTCKNVRPAHKMDELSESVLSL